MPSMSWPRCVCASKISAPSGSSRRSSASYTAMSSCARARTSVIPGQSIDVSWCEAPSPRLGSRPMPDVLIYDDTVRSQELRHEVPLLVPDPFLYVEQDGVRHVVAHAMELARMGELGME